MGSVTPIAAATMARTAARTDGWANLTTGLGDALRDKRLTNAFTTSVVSWAQAEDLYRGDELAARIAELLPADMTRQGWEVVVEGDKDAGKDINQALKALGVVEKFRQAETWARVFGGAILLMGPLDGSQDLTQPLDEEHLDALEYLNLFDMREAIGVAWYGDPQAPKYGETVMYRLQPLTLSFSSGFELTLREQEKQGKYSPMQVQEKGLGSNGSMTMIRYVHASRVLRFEGTKLTRRLERSQWGWGDSIYTRLVDEVRDFQASFDSASVLVQDFAQGVFKMAGLAEAIAGGQQSLVLARLTAMDLARSVVRATVVDKEGEDFERKSTPVTGLAELLDKFMLKISAATGYPVSLLFGQAPAGMDATGESDIRLYYDKVKGEQVRIFAPPLERLVSLLLRSKQGPTKGTEPESWSLKFHPLWQLDDVQKATARKTQADADVAYVNAGVLMPEEVAASRFGGDEYSFETQLVEADPEKRALAAAEAAAEQSALEQPAPESGDGGKKADE